MTDLQAKNVNKFNIEYNVEGMHCAACELLIESKFFKKHGVEKVKASLGKGKVYLQVKTKFSKEELRKKLSKLIEPDGYKLVIKKEKKKKTSWAEMVYAFVIASSIMLLFLLLQELGIINIAQTDNVNLPFVFLIGIIASLSTCMAVVGGLVLTLSSNYSKGNQMLPIIVFHASRVIGFFFLGGIIGLIGSAFILSQTASFILSIILFAVMIIIGINLLDIFPFVSKLQPQMPKFFGKNVLKAGQKSSALTPLFLGLLTFFLPCGFTQSMQIYSLTTGSFLEGALTMTVFSLGTLPVLSLISFASIKLSKSLQSGLFFKSAGILVIFFAVFNLHGSLTAAGII